MSLGQPYLSLNYVQLNHNPRVHESSRMIHEHTGILNYGISILWITSLTRSTRKLIRLTNSCNILTHMTYGPMQPMNPFGPSTYATHVKLVLYIVYYTNYSIARVHVLKVASTGERVIHWWAYKSHPKLTLFLPG